jgi:hypothetical protein
MAVVYAADLAVVQRGSWLQPAVDEVITCVAPWAGFLEGSTEGLFPGRRPRSTVNGHFANERGAVVGSAGAYGICQAI